MDDINQILISGLIEKGEFKEFYTKISDILREYIEREFLIPAIYMTTKDIIKGISNIILDIKDILTLREFLDRCDLVKFAKYIPQMEEAKMDIEKLKNLINLMDNISKKSKEEKSLNKVEGKNDF